MDILVEKGVKGVIITGPNTGGKTACMKAIGCASLMARCGLGVPASGLVIVPSFDEVYADIGDDQSLSSNLSTFSSHVGHIKGILRHSKGSSLILLDELGTGTDPAEGAALGCAIVRACIQGKAALMVATTHLRHISHLKYREAAIENAAVGANYQILWGQAGKSNALSIAKGLGLQEEILDDAMTRRKEGAINDGGDDYTTSLMDADDAVADTLEGLREELSRCASDIEAGLEEAGRRYENCARIERSLRMRQVELNRESTAKLTQLVSDSRSELGDLVRQKEKEEKQSRAAARERDDDGSKMSKLASRAMSKSQKRRRKDPQKKNLAKRHASKAAQMYRPGSKVLIPQFKAIATVVSVRGDDLVVQMGPTMKVKVKASSVKPC